MSITTTSASCLSATPRATVAPTFPAPPTTITLRFISAPVEKALRLPRLPCPPRQRLCLHVVDDGVPEFRCLQFGCAVHQPREVVRHALGGDRAVHPLDDEIGRLGPPEVAQHHLAREDHGARVHLVLTG